MARFFLEKGHKIFLVDLNEEGLKHTVKEHLNNNDRISYVACNLRSVDEIRSSVKKAADFFGGRIDFLINNAGISGK